MLSYYAIDRDGKMAKWKKWTDRQIDRQTYRQTKNCFKCDFTDLFRYYSSTLTEMARWAYGRNGQMDR